MIKTLLTALTLTASTIAPMGAEASTFNDHIRLAQAVRATGTRVKINPKECGATEAFGWYWARKSELVICQENGIAGGPEVVWTEEDLDTLRHEAQHLVQDCMDSSLDGSLDSVYQDPIRLGKEVIGERGMVAVAKAYAEQGDHIIVMEIEAFSVAALNDPAEQANDIASFCF
tara:strand:+ start:115 stop:633 length:519 start_codon:yes stop_codon:yes gene_type:complete